MNASCVQDATGALICVCNLGFVGSGESCEATTTTTTTTTTTPNPCDACDANASCNQDDMGNTICLCNFGFSGDGTRIVQNQNLSILFNVTLFLISNSLKVVKLLQQARLQLLPLPTRAKLAMQMLRVKPRLAEM